MPCYNSAAYVRHAVESIRQQSYPNWELIAVNDGSTDKTLDILNDFAEHDKRIRVYSKENGGYCSAVNYGLEHVTGDYFLFLGSDDSLGVTLFQDIVNHIILDLPDMIGFRSVVIMDGENAGNTKETRFETIASYNGRINEFARLFPQHTDIFLVRDTSKCFRTSLLGDLRYFGKSGLDADGIFSTLFSLKATSFLSLPIDGYYWTIRSNSLSAELTKEKNFDRLNNWIHFLTELKQYNIEIIREPAKKYYLNAHFVGLHILKQTTTLNLKELHLIGIARRKSYDMACRLHLEENFPLCPKNKMKKTIFLAFPDIWSFYFKNKKV